MWYLVATMPPSNTIPARRARRGTTLVEILVVVVIMVIIASIVYAVGHGLWRAVMNLKR
jgi:prepilin-type N-terminal cleavage/methylation domain-containing protein